MKPFLTLFIVVAMLSSNRSVAQDSTTIDSTAADPPYRDPQRARTLATLIPGAGHIYSGEYLRGYGFWVGTVAGITVGAALYDQPCAFAAVTQTRCGSDELWSSHLTGIALVSLGLWTWISSVRDAPRAAERANIRHAHRLPKVTPLIRLPPEQGGGWRAGVSVGW